MWGTARPEKWIFSLGKKEQTGGKVVRQKPAGWPGAPHGPRTQVRAIGDLQNRQQPTHQTGSRVLFLAVPQTHFPFVPLAPAAAGLAS